MTVPGAFERLIRRIGAVHRRVTLPYRQRKAPCDNCGRTLLNQRLRSPLQLLFGGWTCSRCGHSHHQRRGRQAPATVPVLIPAK